MQCPNERPFTVMEQPPASLAPVAGKQRPGKASSDGSSSSFLDDIDVPASDSEWKDVDDDWAVEEEAGELGVVPASSSSRSPTNNSGGGAASEGESASARIGDAAEKDQAQLSDEGVSARAATEVAAAPATPASVARAEAAPGSSSPIIAQHTAPAPAEPSHATPVQTPAVNPDALQAPPEQRSPAANPPPPLPRGSSPRLDAAAATVQVPPQDHAGPLLPSTTSEISAVQENETPAPAMPNKAMREPPVQQAADPPVQAAASFAWGWGASLQAFGGKLQQVAAGTVQELQSSLVELQQALAEVETSTDADEDDGRRTDKDEEQDQGAGDEAGREMAAPTTAAPMDRAQEGGSRGPAASGAEAGAAAAAGYRRGGIEEDERQEVQDAEEAEEEDVGEEDQLAGLKVIDDQMEQLTTGAAKAFSSLGSLLTGVAKGGWSVGQVIASKVEAATKEMSAGVSEDMQELQQAARSGFKGAAGSVTKLGTTLEKSIGTVSRTAYELLLENPGPQGSAVPSLGPSAEAELEHEPSSFKGLFQLFGGAALREELQRLSNECARTCNRARARLEPAQQQQLDLLLAELAQQFVPLLLQPRAAGDGDSCSVEEDVEEVRACKLQLELRYEPAVHLTNKALAEAGAGGGGGRDEGGAGSSPGGHDKRLVQLLAAQVQVLLDMGGSLAAPARGVPEGRSPAEALAWPQSPREQGALIRWMAQRMVGDVLSIAAACAGSRTEAGELGTGPGAEQVQLSTRANSGGSLDAEGLGQAVGTEAAAAGGAVELLQDSYRDLLYCVLVRSLVTEVAVQ